MKNGFWANVVDALCQAGRHWFLFLILVLAPALAVWGVIGEGFGFALLFRDAAATGQVFWSLDSWIHSPAFYGNLSFTFFGAMAWLMTSLLLPDDENPIAGMSIAQEFAFLMARALPLSALFIVLALLPISKSIPELSGYEIIRSLSGVLVALVLIAGFVAASRGMSSATRIERRYVAYVMLALMIVGLHFVQRLVPVGSVYKLAGTISGLYLFIMFFSPRWRAWVTVAVLILPVGVAALVDTPKYTFPGLTPEYDCPVVLEDRAGGVAERPKGTTKCGTIPAAPDRLKPTEALNAFYARSYGEETKDAGGRKLVVMATSGGAYRASFWTALVLDRLKEMEAAEADTSGQSLTDHIRLVTGASGGMVAGAYFAVDPESNGVVEAIEQDITDQQIVNNSFQNPRDTLSDVLQQLVMWDVVHIVLPGTFGKAAGENGPSPSIRLHGDRGRTLQSHWETLDVDFASHAGAVAAGRSPSIIFSPMILETGQPLVISDLDLSDTRRTAIEGAASPQTAKPSQQTLDFFSLFPESFNRFTLQTAVRMNATFPIVSPNVDLPTEPRRRVVDAGYADNYGVAAAVEYLMLPQVRDWLEEHNFSGAIVMQVNAFPVLRDYPVTEEAGLCQRDGARSDVRVMEWVTAPAEGAAAARSRAMVYRNEQALRSLKQLYDQQGLDLSWVAFENTKRASMSWFLTEQELGCMADELDAPHNRQSFKDLMRLWAGTPGE